MEKMWSPWRSNYIDSFKNPDKNEGCVFCKAQNIEIDDDDETEQSYPDAQAQPPMAWDSLASHCMPAQSTCRSIIDNSKGPYIIKNRALIHGRVTRVAVRRRSEPSGLRNGVAAYPGGGRRTARPGIVAPTFGTHGKGRRPVQQTDRRPGFSAVGCRYQVRFSFSWPSALRISTSFLAHSLL